MGNSFEKSSQNFAKIISYKEKDVLQKTIITQFEVVKTFILICQRSTMGGNQITDEVFSPRTS